VVEGGLRFWREFLLALALPAAAVVYFAIMLGLDVMRIGTPSAALLVNVGQAGVGFLIAYSVSVAAIRIRRTADQEKWLGYICGIGVAGLLGIVACFASAAYREAGHAGPFDKLGLVWSAFSILTLGGLIAFLPLVNYAVNVSEPTSSLDD
jgi:hypothetical protein